MDTDEQTRRRTSTIEGLCREVVCLYEYVRQLKSAYEFAVRRIPAYKIIINNVASPVGENERRYNALTTQDVANLMPNGWLSKYYCPAY